MATFSPKHAKLGDQVAFNTVWPLDVGSHSRLALQPSRRWPGNIVDCHPSRSRSIPFPCVPGQVKFAGHPFEVLGLRQRRPSEAGDNRQPPHHQHRHRQPATKLVEPWEEPSSSERSPLARQHTSSRTHSAAPARIRIAALAQSPRMGAEDVQTLAQATCSPPYCPRTPSPADPVVPRPTLHLRHRTHNHLHPALIQLPQSSKQPLRQSLRIVPRSPMEDRAHAARVPLIRQHHSNLATEYSQPRAATSPDLQPAPAALAERSAASPSPAKPIPHPCHPAAYLACHSVALVCHSAA